MVKREWVPTGQRLRVDNPGDRLPDYDPRSGEHCWVVITTYQVDPKVLNDPDALPMLDHENLLYISPYFCYFCEQPYAQRLLTRRCAGHPS